MGNVRAGFAVAIGLFAAVLSSCDGKVHLTGKKVVDFARSEIISNGPVLADGSSEMIVVIQLMNSDGTPIKFFKPSYEIKAGAGVQGSECTTSNIHGVSTCVLKSTQQGVKKFVVTNVKIALEKDLVFLPPTPKGAVTGLVPAAKYKSKAVTGHELTGTIGSVHSEAVKRSPTGWKLYGGPEGNAVSR